MLREPLVKTEIFKDGEWIVTKYESIKKGDIFRTYVDSKGTKLSSDNKGNTTFIAKQNAYTENRFKYTISCQPYKIE